MKKLTSKLKSFVESIEYHESIKNSIIEAIDSIFEYHNAPDREMRNVEYDKLNQSLKSLLLETAKKLNFIDKLHIKEIDYLIYCIVNYDNALSSDNLKTVVAQTDFGNLLIQYGSKNDYFDFDDFILTLDGYRSQFSSLYESVQGNEKQFNVVWGSGYELSPEGTLKTEILSLSHVLGFIDTEGNETAVQNINAMDIGSVYTYNDLSGDVIFIRIK